MEIPMNDYEKRENEQIESACNTVIESINSKGYFEMVWSEYPEWLAREVSKIFIKRGYHASETYNVSGRTGGWFWYCISISKCPLSDESYPKSRTTVIG